MARIRRRAPAERHRVRPEDRGSRAKLLAREGLPPDFDHSRTDDPEYQAAIVAYRRRIGYVARPGWDTGWNWTDGKETTP